MHLGNWSFGDKTTDSHQNVTDENERDRTKIACHRHKKLHEAHQKYRNSPFLPSLSLRTQSAGAAGTVGGLGTCSGTLGLRPPLNLSDGES